MNSSRSGHKEKDAMLFLADYEQGNIDSSELIVYEE